MASSEDSGQEEAEAARRSRQTGGDAPAAGSVEEREDVARGGGDAFGDDEPSEEGADEPADAGRAGDAGVASGAAVEDDDVEEEASEPAEPRHGGYR